MLSKITYKWRTEEVYSLTDVSIFIHTYYNTRNQTAVTNPLTDCNF